MNIPAVLAQLRRNLYKSMFHVKHSFCVELLFHVKQYIRFIVMFHVEHCIHFAKMFHVKHEMID